MGRRALQPRVRAGHLSLRKRLRQAACSDGRDVGIGTHGRSRSSKNSNPGCPRPGARRGHTAHGLSEAQARARLRADGPNALPDAEHRSTAAVLAALSQPMVMILCLCAGLYALLGSAFDAAALSVSVVAVAGLSVFQELRTQRVLEALRALASPRSLVVRDGEFRRISSRELVVSEGDRLACDARLLESHSLRLDESLLTGESEPVDKEASSGAEAAALHAGTLVVQGDGVALVTATGPRTQLGRIGRSLASVVPRPSRLQAELCCRCWAGRCCCCRCMWCCWS